ncbi:unnamed protein product [Paramecium octaurelia]|uniref:Transmembrane protein n=1 Tax=Paramecium octaurelia TaxID=43137 RepID=A0A8S1TG37_PAROT|nr:unnamed protein product [Paramecium octaurelia]
MEEINTQKQEDSPAPSGKKIQPEEDFELQALFYKLNSTIDETPFHETKCQKQKQDLSYKAEFIMTHFIKFYIYQLMFYIFGPFVYLFLVNKPALMFNLGFWSCRQDVVFQYIQWVGHIVCLLMYFYFKSLSSLEIGQLWFSLLTRSIIVAAKFSTLNEERVALYENTLLSKNIIYFDVVLFDWAIQSKKIKNLEIAKAAKRHGFDTQFFYFDFLVEPLKETQNALFDDKETQLNLPLRGLILNTRKNQVSVALLISFIVVITPKVLAYERYLQNPAEIFLNIICGVFQILQFNCIFLYLLISLEDMKRKIFLLDQVYYLISTKRVRCNEFKLTPTIDINCPRTIEAWSMLRSIAFDYGASYHIRNQIYHTILILCSVASIIFAFQIILDYFQLDYYYLITLGILKLINFLKILYFIIEIIVFIYKGYGLFYPPNKIGIEIFLQFLLAFCQFPRLILGSIGNKTESPSQILWFVLLIFPCIFLYIFFIVLQTYVVILEIIINVIALIFIVFEFVFSLSAFLTLKTMRSNNELKIINIYIQLVSNKKFTLQNLILQMEDNRRIIHDKESLISN